MHAVPRPVEAPRPARLEPIRAAGDTGCRFRGGIDVHGASTESVNAEAFWTDPVDDVGLPAPEHRSRRAVAFMDRSSLSWLTPGEICIVGERLLPRA